MGLAHQSFHSARLCECLRWQEPKLQRECRPSKRSLGKLSHSATHLGRRPTRIFTGSYARRSSSLNAHRDAPYSASQGLQNELHGFDLCHSSNPTDDVHNPHDAGLDACTSSSPPTASTYVNCGQIDQRGPYACVDGVQVDGQTGPHACARSDFLSDDVHMVGQRKFTTGNCSNVSTDADDDMLRAHNVLPSTHPLEEANSSSDDTYQDVKGYGTSTMEVLGDVNSAPRRSSNTDEVESKGKIRRFSLNEPALLSTLQEVRALNPLEQENLELLMKFKLTNDNLKGRLVIRAVRTEQLKDLENLLTDSYSELMWGPLTYRPALAWILSMYLQERQAYRPHAVTLVGLYSPSEASTDHEGSPHKWWVAGAVEVSFNASGKPKDMQTPMPPEDAPFLSNMAVLKRFRRRGIGQELLRAAEQLVVQMGGKEIYLHCRMIDEAPLNMYKNAGYAIVETDSMLSLLLFQRRRHLMYKALAAPLYEGNMVSVN